MFDRLRLLSSTTILLVGTLTPVPHAASAVVGEIGAAHHDSEMVRDAPLARPHLIDDAFADVIVRLHGHVCTGTPITGTVYVVTAAHCVLSDSGEVERRTIVRNHVRYPAVAVLINTAYFDHPSEELDVAVLIMAQVIPGPSARVGTSLPNSGQVTLAGYQPIDSDGSLMRDRQPDNGPLSQGATGTPNDVPYRPAGCVDVSPVAGSVGRSRHGSLRIGSGSFRRRAVHRGQRRARAGRDPLDRHGRSVGERHRAVGVAARTARAPRPLHARV